MTGPTGAWFAHSDACCPGPARAAAEEFTATVSDPEFPCYFARPALSAGEVRFAYVDDEARIVPVMREAVAALRDCRTLVLVLFLPVWDVGDLDADRASASRFVELLRRSDTSPWPPDVPGDPGQTGWCFHYEGLDLFLNFNSPNHRLRRSRSLGSHFTVVVQCRSAFDHHPGVTATSRELIRQRVASYDDVPPHPALSTFGEPDNREAWQYFLGEDNDERWVP